MPTLAEAEAFGARATAELGCATAPDVAGRLRERTVAELLPVLADIGWELNSRVSDRPWNPYATDHRCGLWAGVPH